MISGIVDRAGLRYQRRGVDDDANVANFVETEAVVQIEVWLVLECTKLDSTWLLERRSLQCFQLHTVAWVK